MAGSEGKHETGGGCLLKGGQVLVSAVLGIGKGVVRWVLPHQPITPRTLATWAIRISLFPYLLTSIPGVEQALFSPGNSVPSGPRHSPTRELQGNEGSMLSATPIPFGKGDTVCTTNYMNIRGEEGRILATVRPLTPVLILESAPAPSLSSRELSDLQRASEHFSGGWAGVQASGVTGYGNTDYLKPNGGQC